MPLLVLVATLLGAALLGLALAIEERRRSAPPLPPPRPPGEPAAATVLLPVRDEAADVLPCVETLLAQTVHPRVLVIDDGSTDGTAALVAARAAAEPRLELLTAPPLPAGWRGKVHALAAGSRQVATEWLATTDADTRHHPEALARALAAAAERRLDAVSLAGLQETRGPGENLLVPAVFALLDARLGDWAAAAAGAGPAVANGQFILVRRQAWESCGGFETVRAAPIDDVALAERLRAGGFATGFFRAPEALRVRMYHGFGAAAEGWRRNLGGIFGPHPGAAAAALAVLLAPPLALLASLATGSWLAAAILWTAGAASSAVLRAGGGHAPAFGLLYPLDALLLAWVLARGALDYRRGGTVRWKGREMALR